MKNVLYISYDGMTDPLGQSQVIPYLQGLSKLGYKFTLLSAEKPEKFKQHGEFIAAMLKESGIDWEPIVYTATPPVLSTFMDVRKMRKMASLLHHKKKFDLVHARGHYTTSLVASYIKKKFNVKYVFDMRGFWADERIDGGLWSLINPLYRTIYNFFKRKETDFLNLADYVITLTTAAEVEIHSWKNLAKQPINIQVIPCCADLDHFSKNNINKEKLEALKIELGINNDDFIVSYIGSLGTWYMLDEMLQMFSHITKEKANAKLLVITNDPGEKIKEKATALHINTNNIIICQASRNDIPYYISCSSVSLFFIKPAYSKIGSSPTKMGEIMGLGIPLIGNANVGDVEMIIKDTGCGICINDFSEPEYIRVAKNINNLLSIDKKQIINGAEKYYSLEKGVEKYLSVYKKVLG